jgi:hypothetical protein
MQGEILRGSALWSYDYELAAKSRRTKFLAGLFSFIKPLNDHESEIVLTNAGLSIIGDEELSIPLSAINEMYLGFDSLFPATSAKNFGAFWQPIRLEYLVSNESRKIYLNIDYNGTTSHNQLWYDTIKELLS